MRSDHRKTKTRPNAWPARRLNAVVLAVCLLCGAAPARAQLIPAFGSDRAGTSGFQFLKISPDARAAAMGETVAANAFDASALFWNPALAAQIERPQFGLSHTRYYTGISVDYVAALYRLGGFTVGASVHALNSGDMDVTTEFQPFGTGETFRLIDIAAGLTVAQQLSDLFSYGVTARYVQESVAGLTARTAVFDLGIFYRIGTTGAQMAVAIRNFGLDGRPSGDLERLVVGGEGVVVENDFEALTPPTTFLLGLSYSVLPPEAANALTVSGQLTNPNDHAESFNVGAEYVWNRTLALRAGYRFGVEEFDLPSVGAGVMVPGLPGGIGARFDYAFSRLELLGTVHRVGLNLSL
jgi:hypothetical protein